MHLRFLCVAYIFETMCSALNGFYPPKNGDGCHLYEWGFNQFLVIKMIMDILSYFASVSPSNSLPCL